MFNYPRYSLSLSHGFCHPVECLQYLPGLTAHINLLKLGKSFSPGLIQDLPEYQVNNTLTPCELEFAFLVHTMLNSSLYWHSEQPITKIPKNLAKPTILLSQLLKRPPILSLVSIQYHNWVYSSRPGDFHPDNLQNYFKFSDTRDEDYFFSVNNYVEFLGTPGLISILELPDHYEHPTNFKNSLEKIAKSLEKMTKALDIIPLKVDPSCFYNGFRKKLRSFGLVEFEDTNTHYENLMGGSAVQSPLIKVFDSFIGLEHKNEFMKNSEKYMKTQHQEILQIVRNRDRDLLIQNIHKFKCQSAFNEIVQNLIKFRTKHIEISQEYVVKQSSNRDSTGTGGSPLIQFLSRIKENTQSLLLSNNS